MFRHIRGLFVILVWQSCLASFTLFVFILLVDSIRNYEDIHQNVPRLHFLYQTMMHRHKLHVLTFVILLIMSNCLDRISHYFTILHRIFLISTSTTDDIRKNCDYILLIAPRLHWLQVKKTMVENPMLDLFRHIQCIYANVHVMCTKPSRKSMYFP